MKDLIEEKSSIENNPGSFHKRPDSLRKYIDIAIQKTTIHTSLQISFVAGTVLNLIHYFEDITQGDYENISIPQCLLTYLVPYCVSTISRVRTLKTLHLSEFPDLNPFHVFSFNTKGKIIYANGTTCNLFLECEKDLTPIHSIEQMISEALIHKKNSNYTLNIKNNTYLFKFIIDPENDEYIYVFGLDKGDFEKVK